MNYRIAWSNEGITIGATYIEASCREHAELAARMNAIGATARAVTTSAELDELVSVDAFALGEDHSFMQSSLTGYWEA